MTESAPELVLESIDDEFLEEYHRAWGDGNAERIVEMMTPDCIYEASFGPDPWGKRFVGRDDVRDGIRQSFPLFKDGATEKHYERHVFGNHGFERWTHSYAGPNGDRVSVHGCDYYEFRDGLVHRKIAFRKSFVDW